MVGIIDGFLLGSLVGTTVGNIFVGFGLGNFGDGIRVVFLVGVTDFDGFWDGQTVGYRVALGMIEGSYEGFKVGSSVGSPIGASGS